ncbi:MAG: tRNA (N(6)-L-threonylcarbamoyladenosine(37)-C(2))-methylthiotransferase MtaB [Candidatus Omnitrophica bacterium]|nr:tRNA (N(6)-L-threonylcarbamoyladenosine(37)-C(2))-methylthiotransferase MtaB [Candidatus Omnitrophota bacterium]
MRIKFLTLGCKVNQYETQALKEEFSRLGHIICDSDADMCVINTCSVTHRADRKSIEAILSAKKRYPKAKIVVTGCFAQYDGKKIKELGVDYIIPQDKKQSLVGLINNGTLQAKNIWSLKISSFSNERAFLKIQDGCDFCCSFCKIPYIRGNSVSRKKEEVIEEFKRLARYHKEIVLCGVNLALYGKDLSGYVRLKTLINEILELGYPTRIRLSSLEPCLVTDQLIKIFSHPKICPHIHLPFQSGDDTVLEKMNKVETVSLYKDLVYKLRKINPSIAISCDMMIGFPAENDLTFQNTVDFLKDVRPMRMHIFTFSPRNLTAFSDTKIKDQRIIYKRYNFLKKLAFDFSIEYKKSFLGKTQEMIIEEQCDGYVVGYTQNYIRVWLKGIYPKGEIIAVKITSVSEDGKVFASI